ncbi:hypothetical protein Ahy_A07g033560 [Arachis hypogaea]|uniref:GRF-type domain-containing protein n=1 Tax=Arachis hypogaea TaxID=3818 RepID=A0A445C9H0_ARAHY|nr:hypothetical protein Ahy_A07g033560 [Arachis hypogaea]
MVVLLILIASDGSSLITRQCGGGGRRQEGSVVNAAPCSVQAGDEKDGVAPKCFCGMYAIFYLSKTNTNPNRLFFGCPFFKISSQFFIYMDEVKQPYCKFFVWVDNHIERIGCMEPTKKLDDNQSLDVEEYFGKKKLENKMTDLEQSLIYLENKKSSNF